MDAIKRLIFTVMIIQTLPTLIMLKTIVLSFDSNSKMKISSMLSERNVSFIETDSVSSFLNNIGFQTQDSAPVVIILPGEKTAKQDIVSLTNYIRRYRPGTKFFVYSDRDYLNLAGLGGKNYFVFHGNEAEMIEKVQSYVVA